MQTPLLAKEHEIREGLATMQAGLEGVGGRLFLTSQRLIFEPHSVNIQRSKAILALDDIVNVRKSWAKLLFIIPVLPNVLRVDLKSGEKYRFVVYGRSKWAKAIGDQKRMSKLVVQVVESWPE